MSETLFSLEEIAEAFKYIQDDKLSIDAKAMLTMDIGYEKAEKDIVKLLEQMPQNDGAKSAGFGDLLDRQAAIALINGWSK